MTEDAVPSFPVYVILPVFSATLLFVLIKLPRPRNPFLIFIVLASWFRYSSAALHKYTYPPLFLGLSLMAIISIAVILVGLSLVYKYLFLRHLRSIYIMIFITILSAICNQELVGAINATLKWLYLIVFSLGTYLAMKREGPERVFRPLSIIFMGPIVLQWLSFALGMRRVEDADGTVSFIGGYEQHQTFSIIMLTFLYVTCFLPNLTSVGAYGRMAIAAIGIGLANYRTTILAAALPFASLLILRLMRNFAPRQRAIVFVFLSALGMFIFIGIASVAQERFSDLGSVLNRGASLIQSPEYFTMEEKRIFSGRVYWWSKYIDAYLDGDIIRIIIGFGPESWIGRFLLYAHNTFISYLYELGIIGLLSFTWLLLSNFLVAACARGPGQAVLISCHIGFLVLNLATMPIWTLEGDILYAVLLAQTWYSWLLTVNCGNVQHRVLRGWVPAHLRCDRV